MVQMYKLHVIICLSFSLPLQYFLFVLFDCNLLQLAYKALTYNGGMARKAVASDFEQIIDN